MLLLFFFAFISGLFTILAPCIWPLLPIILSTSVINGSTSHKRPLGVTLGVMLSFAFFTLSISFLIRAFHLDPNALRLLAVFVIGFLGFMLLVPSFGRIVEGLVSQLSGKFAPHTLKQRQDFFGGLFAGFSLGIVWSPCAGPILASIAALSATGDVSLELVLVTFFYVLGIGIPLFFFAFFGQRVVTRTRVFSQYTGRLNQVFGLLMIITAVLIFTNYDKVIEAKLLNIFPEYSSALNAFEGNTKVTQELSRLKGQENLGQIAQENALFNVASYSAPNFVGITNWLNSQPLNIKELKGKVVLVDFWTYTCINCIRTLPHVTSWYNTYKDNGFVVVGVHTPEFAFEKETANVQKAIQQFGITYPVAQDNDYKTWNAYNNQYWPAEYLIDANGQIRRTHFGEGEYDEMEKAIQMLLKEAGQKITTKVSDMPDTTPTGQLSPETYVGSRRMQYLYPNGGVGNGRQTFTIKSTLAANSFSFGGTWDIQDEFAKSGMNASIVYNFYANKVFLVMRPPEGKIGKVTVFLDGEKIDPEVSGEDVKDGVVTIDSDRLYELVNLQGQTGQHVLKIDFQTPGTQAFAFTFG